MPAAMQWEGTAETKISPSEVISRKWFCISDLSRTVPVIRFLGFFLNYLNLNRFIVLPTYGEETGVT
jgi:hypothetical protein